MKNNGFVTVWDRPTRIFHWALVGFVTTSFVTAEIGGNAMQYHVWSGYAILTLLFFRLVWGFIGSRTALLNGMKNSSLAVPDLLHAVGSAALGGGGSLPGTDDVEFGPAAATQNRELGSLLSRSAVCWIVVLSLLVLLF